MLPQLWVVWPYREFKLSDIASTKRQSPELVQHCSLSVPWKGLGKQLNIYDRQRGIHPWEKTFNIVTVKYYYEDYFVNPIFTSLRSCKYVPNPANIGRRESYFNYIKNKTYWDFLLMDNYSLKEFISNLHSLGLNVIVLANSHEYWISKTGSYFSGHVLISLHCIMLGMKNCLIP